jgi:hypothetical protein
MFSLFLLDVDGSMLGYLSRTLVIYPENVIRFQNINPIIVQY